MSAGHTPGPWDYERAIDRDDLARPWVGRLADNRFAALSCGETYDEAVANARLIAAAPELLEALGWFVSDERFQVAVGGNPNVVERMIADAKAIHAKATGEQP